MNFKLAAADPKHFAECRTRANSNVCCGSLGGIAVTLGRCPLDLSNRTSNWCVGRSAQGQKLTSERVKNEYLPRAKPMHSMQ